MKNLKKRLGLFLAMWLSCAAGFAQDQAETPAMDKLLSSYEVQRAELQVPLVAWTSRYTSELAKLEKKLQADGDLEQLLKVREELQQVENGGGTEIPPAYALLKRMRSFYDQRMVQLQQSQQTSLRELNAGYRKQLATMQETLTRAGKIDEAIEIRNHLKSLEANTPIATRPRPLRSNRNPRARSGELGTLWAATWQGS